MFDVAMILARQSELESARSSFAATWQEVADYVLPRQAHFRGANSTQGVERTRRIIDSHAMLALDKGVAAFEGLVMPRGTRWQLLRPADEALGRIQRVAAWYETITQRLFRRRNDPESGFVGQAHESVASLLAMGNQSMWVDLRYNQFGQPEGLRYQSEHLDAVTIEENFQGIVDRSNRKMRLSAREALRKFGRAALVRAPKVLDAATDPNKETREFEFLHVIMPNMRIEEGRMDWRGKPFTGLYISCEDKEIIDTGGFRSSPRTYSRLDKASNEVYGRGRAMDVLPEIRESQQVRAAIVAATEMNAMPPLAAHDDMLDQTIHYSANGITYGAVDDRGNMLIRKLLEEVDLSAMYAGLEALHGTIDEAFYVDMFMVRQEVKTHVTATEIMERNAEKGLLLAPLGRQETEWFSPMLDRELDLMAELGDFDDMPPEVAEAGGAVQIVYDNDLNRLMASNQAAGYYRTAEQVGALAAIYPDAGPEFARMYPLAKVIPAIADINAVPATWRATDEELADAEARDAEQQQLAQLAELLPAVGGAARDLSVAEANANG